MAHGPGSERARRSEQAKKILCAETLQGTFNRRNQQSKENKETEKTKIEQAEFTATISLIQEQERSDPQAARKNCTAHSKVRKMILLLRSNKFTTNSYRSPFSLPHLIRMRIYFLTHFYYRKYEMKLRSGKEPHPL
jgi:hypothetical protein